MAGGWSRDGAVQEQIDASIEDAVVRARSRLPEGESASECEDCDDPIPERRRKALPGVRLCVKCQAEADEAQSRDDQGLYNRRGSKDSQLR
jgi:phage/conjugal plasmid C-4 type zinc finger TraR family protein